MSDMSARQLIAHPIRTVLLQPRSAATTLVAVAVQLFTVLPIPFLIQRIFDESIPAGDTEDLVLTGSAVIVLFIVGAAFSVLVHRHLTKLAEASSRQIRDRLVERVYELPLAELHRRGSDDLFDLMLLETARFSGALSVVLSKLAPAVVIVAGLSLVLLMTDWLLFLVSALFAPAMIFMNWAITSRLHDRQVKLNDSRKAYGAGLKRTLALMPLTRVSDASESESARQRLTTKDLEDRSVDHSVLAMGYTASQQSIVITAALVTLIVGGLGVIDGRISLGTLFSFYAGIALLRPPLDRIVHARPVITSGRIAVRRFDEIFDHAIRAPYSGSKSLDFEGLIDVDAVEFGYDPANSVV
ncbi:MAG: ABC transporter ATP-binding protein, partial [Acidimicrobiales bacterium]